MSESKRLIKILERLEALFPNSWKIVVEDPFSELIRAILSQNCSDILSTRAFECLRRKFLITPEVLANVKPKDVMQLIRCAGLYRIKSRRIVNVSKIVLDRFKGNLEDVLKLPFDQARKTLMSISGVGEKTADVMLCFCGDFPVIPIDTHINRVAKRLGIVKIRNAGYEMIRSTLEALIPVKDYRKAHILLITLGRKYCKARKPSCTICPLSDLCPKLI
ncbi:endonuclease III [Candidatus Bathyarchaeota archaeon]|nr:endonuclease III [Candidatus Bathyarchaeota archaeon]